jgi:sugar lactone lactonase YvrE
VHKPLRRYGLSALILTLGVGALALTLVKLPVVSSPTSAVAAGDPPTAARGQGPVTAGGDPPRAAVAGPALQVLVRARNLNNPRGVTLTRDGSVLVAEAGVGGDGACLPSPENPDGQVCLGDTGSVSEVSRTGQRRVITGLPSIAAKGGRNAIGPSDVSMAGRGVALLSLGLVNETSRRKELGPLGALLGTVRSHTLAGGSRQIADTSAFEDRENPDGGRRDSNPTGVLPLDDGGVAIVDAGGNRLFAIDRDGGIRTLAVFPTQQVPAPTKPGATTAAKVTVESVPTSITTGPDGALYVGELTGFPFATGVARIWRVVPGQQPTVYATGFTNIIDLAFDRQGRLFVLEISKYGLRSADKTGALIRVDPDGGRTELLSKELTAPGGMALSPDGSLYISNRATSGGTGELLEVRT